MYEVVEPIFGKASELVYGKFLEEEYAFEYYFSSFSEKRDMFVLFGVEDGWLNYFDLVLDNIDGIERFRLASYGGDDEFFERSFGYFQSDSIYSKTLVVNSDTSYIRYNVNSIKGHNPTKKTSEAKN